MKTIKCLLTVLFLFCVFTFTYAQECGPFCPVCSGTGSSTSSLVAPGTLIPTILYIPGGEEESAVMNLRTGVTPWLDVGIGYTVKSDKIIWSARLQAIKEQEDGLRPAVLLGTGSVQTGKSDQSVFLQVSKSWELSELLAFRISAGVASLIPEFDRVYGLAGLVVTITEKWSPFISYDGLNFHPGLSWVPTDWLSLSFIMIETREPALSVGVRLKLWGKEKAD